MKHTHYIIILLLIFSFTHLTAQIRYVSKTGSSTPPYTSWATASDSIQKCIDICEPGDTIIVANGIYKEALVIYKKLWLLGSSMDSTIIDGRNLNGLIDTNVTVYLLDTLTMKNFFMFGKKITPNFSQTHWGIRGYNQRADLENIRIETCGVSIQLEEKNSTLKTIIIKNTRDGIVLSGAYYDTIKIDNSLFYMNIFSGGCVINNMMGGTRIITNNTIYIQNRVINGICFTYTFMGAFIKNNLIIGGLRNNIDLYPAIDTVIIQNNLSMGPNDASAWNIVVNRKGYISNNIIANNTRGLAISASSKSDYNCYWNTVIPVMSGGSMGVNDIQLDPMFMNDTSYVSGNADYRLQRYSPCIDAGDPDILDADGTRSDIGLYGGPLGQSYTYIDLPPKFPKNVTAKLEADSNYIKLNWDKNTESDLSHYNIYRDTVGGFSADSLHLYKSVDTNVYEDYYTPGTKKLFYKLTAIDHQGNESVPSSEIAVTVTGTEKGKIETIHEYILHQNYPNPFNPSTKIGYSLKDRGYVKIMVYNIEAELVSVLVNEEKEAGYYETEFRGKNEKGDLASGIYLYRIEVIGAGQIPRFSDMKKMIFIK